jgi:hypothetical protein
MLPSGFNKDFDLPFPPSDISTSVFKGRESKHTSAKEEQNQEPVKLQKKKQLNVPGIKFTKSRRSQLSSCKIS